MIESTALIAHENSVISHVSVRASLRFPKIGKPATKPREGVHAMKRFVFGLLALCLFAASALAQTSNSGSLVGTVSGPDGVIPGATVTLTDNQTKKERTIVTNGEGGFTLSQIEFGTYTVKVSAPGFKTYTATDLKIDAGREYSLNAALEVGSIQETVTVIAGAEVIN